MEQISKKRKPNWSEDESLFLAKQIEEHKSVLRGKFGPSVTSAKKKEIWMKIAENLESNFKNVKRSPEELEKKWHNIQAKAKVEISAKKKSHTGTGGGPALTNEDLTPVSDVVYNILGKDSPAIHGISNSCLDSTSLLFPLTTDNGLSTTLLDLSEESTVQMIDDIHVPIVMPSDSKYQDMEKKKILLEIECLTLKRDILKMKKTKMQNEM